MPTEEDVWVRVHEPVREAAVPEHEDQTHLLYARGYLVRPDTEPPPGLRLPEHWHRTGFDGRRVHWDPRTPLARAGCGAVEVLLIGRGVHLGLDSVDPGAVTEHLARTRATGREPYQRALDDLAGRYLVLDRGPEGTFAQTDATAMRSLYHDPGASVLASHSRLAAEALGGREPSAFPAGTWLSRSGAFALPGRSTEWDGVHLLTPNTELGLQDGRLHRVGPLPVTRTRSAGLVARRLRPLLQRQLELLCDAAPPLVSLTAGLDSRTTLALSHPVADRLTYFTFRRGYLARDESHRDLEVAHELAGRFGLRHLDVPVAAPLRRGPLRGVLQRNISRPHSRAVAAAYRSELPPDRVHVRSNLYEIGRCFYRGPSQRYQGRLGPREMADILVHRSGAPAADEVVEAFEEWAQATAFAAPEGVDPFDLFYWEHRMAAWLNSHLTESDIAHDTHILVNCRSIYALLLSPSAGQRRWGHVFDELVGLSWPEVYDLPVNGQVRSVPVPPVPPEPTTSPDPTPPP